MSSAPATISEHVYGSAIPSIDDERLAMLVAKIRPVTDPDRREKVAFFPPSDDPRNDYFKWRGGESGEATVELFVHPPFRTLHTFSAPSFFKPTLSEVFAQIPEDYDIRQANAFCIRFVELTTVHPEDGSIRGAKTYHAGEVQLLRVG